LSSTVTDLLHSRGLRMLRTALGPQVCAWLDEPQVSEILLNPDGRLWVERQDRGFSAAPTRMAPEDGERIIRLVAHHLGSEVHARAPRVSAELPGGGERFEGLLPPVVAAPSFAIRKPASRGIALTEYVAAGAMTAAQAGQLAKAAAERKNILVAGPTASGKTTLVNALLAEVARSGDRVVLLEDARELQCAAPNAVALRTVEGVVSMRELVRSALRLRPDRILVGEVRGGEALDLIKAWGTGHPGGVATLHAASALGALQRLEQLVLEASATAPHALIAETVDLVAVMAGHGGGRRLVELARLRSWDPVTGYRLEPAGLEVLP
jgi:type IV secretion system protein TrbB